MSETLTVPEVARLLKKTPKTIRAWITIGAIKAIRFGPNGNWLIPKDALDGFIRRDAGHTSLDT